jgi:hypothetical protein
MAASSFSPNKSITPTADLMSASPNKMFMFFLFHRWDTFLDAMMKPEDVNVDTAIASLLSTCTDTEKRNKFYEEYLKKKEELKGQGGDPKASAAILVSGEFFAYVAEACEFTEKSYGGFC